MIRLGVASLNPVKIAATERGFARMFGSKQCTAEGISVPSGVSDQPKSDQETLQGATTRVQHLIEADAHYDFCVGIEGGIEDTPLGMAAFAWIVVQKTGGARGQAKTATFLLPPQVAELIRQGKEMAEADDIVFGQHNSKQKSGGVGLLTNNAIDRTALYTEAVVLALIPFLSPSYYRI